mgnify:CR=1 FL=1
MKKERSKGVAFDSYTFGTFDNFGSNQFKPASESDQLPKHAKMAEVSNFKEYLEFTAKVSKEQKDKQRRLDEQRYDELFE